MCLSESEMNVQKAAGSLFDIRYYNLVEIINIETFKNTNSTIQRVERVRSSEKICRKSFLLFQAIVNSLCLSSNTNPYVNRTFDFMKFRFLSIKQHQRCSFVYDISRKKKRSR